MVNTAMIITILFTTFTVQYNSPFFRPSAIGGGRSGGHSPATARASPGWMDGLSRRGWSARKRFSPGGGNPSRRPSSWSASGFKFNVCVGPQRSSRFVVENSRVRKPLYCYNVVICTITTIPYAVTSANRAQNRSYAVQF